MFHLVVGQRQSSMMPFTLEELVILSRCLRDACLGIIKLAYPETKPEVREEYIAAFRSVGVTKNTEMQQCIQTEQKRWIQLFKVNCVNCQNIAEENFHYPTEDIKLDFFFSNFIAVATRNMDLGRLLFGIYAKLQATKF